MIDLEDSNDINNNRNVNSGFKMSPPPLPGNLPSGDDHLTGGNFYANSNSKIVHDRSPPPFYSTNFVDGAGLNKNVRMSDFPLLFYLGCWF